MAFEDHVQKAGPEDCWLWQGYIDKCGYGRRGGGDGAHCAAWENVYGPVPEGLEVRHTCHVPACCNPAHLIVGTHAQNMQDMVEAGRSPRGSKHAGNILTEEQAREIKYGGMKISEAASLFGVTTKTVSNIRCGANWKYL